ncbi:hypothetical protein ACFYLB_07770 [Proteus mirabilis]|uniref:hypothetical protein n=1 Tax=Proteus mirabilis TaxID=584 RepID=UPI00367B2D48
MITPPPTSVLYPPASGPLPCRVGLIPSPERLCQQNGFAVYFHTHPVTLFLFPLVIYTTKRISLFATLQVNDAFYAVIVFYPPGDRQNRTDQLYPAIQESCR